jgi:hypothetical protein
MWYGRRRCKTICSLCGAGLSRRRVQGPVDWGKRVRRGLAVGIRSRLVRLLLFALVCDLFVLFVTALATHLRRGGTWIAIAWRHSIQSLLNLLEHFVRGEGELRMLELLGDSIHDADAEGVKAHLRVTFKAVCALQFFDR